MSEKQNINKIKNEARSGDSKAQYKLARLFKEGRVVEKNLESYKNWLEEAAKNKNSAAMKELGDCYATGFSVDLDEMAAMSWYRSAIDEGNIKAHYKIAKILISGLKDTGDNELPEELKEAESLLRVAANEGEMEAQYEIGLFFQTNLRGITKDYLESERWLSAAAEQGHLSAQNSLGYLYAFGSEDNQIKQDQEKAMYWWSKAAEMNHPESQYNLGVVYAKKALQNWTESSKQGNEKSRYMLNQISGYEWNDK